MEESSTSLPNSEITTQENDGNDEKNDGTDMDNDGNEKKYDGPNMKNDGNEAVHDDIEMENRVNGEGKVDEPKFGMMFNSTDEVIDHYRKYAMQLGFPMMRRSSDKDDDGVLRYMTLSCGRAGKPRSSSSNVSKPYACTKTNCKAMVRTTICPDGRWRVSSLKLDHNHELTPEIAQFFRCNQVRKSQVKRKHEGFDGAGTRMNKTSSPLVVDAGGRENMSVSENDCRNYPEKLSQLKLGEGGATSILNYFLKMQAQNANFFHAMDFDKEGLLRNVFWADARSRAAYEEFGDVITFDTTYLTNKYDMPLAQFVGVNHHGQSILFGCGLISSEDTEAFEWLFQSWLTCMSGRSPTGIITDQNKSMEKAIENVFPNARHRWSLWHIMKKLLVNLIDHNQYESIKLALESTVYDSFSHVEFEERWNEIIEKHELNSNEWLIGLYNERRRWVPAYVKESFWAGISPIQQSEIMHSFFDDHINSTTTLKQFLEQYENVLKSKVEKENHEDFMCFSSHPDYVTRYDMEKQVQVVYTTSKFKEFQKELTGKMYCDLASVKAGGAISEYQISEDIAVGEKKKSVNFKVLFHEYDNEVNCSCGMYEFKGIVCRHAIYVLIRHKVQLLPDKYIIRRWRKDLKRCHTGVKVSYDDWNATPEAQRCDTMQQTFNEIKELANDSEDNCSIVISWMHKLKEEIHNRKGDCGNSQPTLNSLTTKSFCGDINSVAKENQDVLTVLTPNNSYGGHQYMPSQVFAEQHFQGQQQDLNGVYGMYSMPRPSAHAVSNQKPS